MLNGKRTKVSGIVLVLWNAAVSIFPDLEPISTPISAVLVAMMGWFLHDKEK